MKLKEIDMKKHTFKFDLGIEAESIISGFTGMITSRLQHLNGCDRYWIAPKVDKDGKLPEGYWLDEGEIRILESEKLKRTNNDRGGFPSKIK